MPRNGHASASPAPRGAARSSRSRPCERWRSARWPSSARARSRWRRRTSAASRSRSTASKAPTGSASSASRRRPIPPHAHAGAAARAARMTHAERVETVRRAFEGQFFPGRTGPPPAAFGWAAASAEDAPVSPPEPAPDPCLRPSREFTTLRRSRRPIRLPTTGRMTLAVRRMYGRARDTWDAHRARDAELRRREAEGRLWPTDPPFCPAAWSGPG